MEGRRLPLTGHASFIGMIQDNHFSLVIIMIISIYIYIYQDLLLSPARTIIVMGGRRLPLTGHASSYGKFLISNYYDHINIYIYQDLLLQPARTIVVMGGRRLPLTGHASFIGMIQDNHFSLVIIMIISIYIYQDLLLQPARTIVVMGGRRLPLTGHASFIGILQDIPSLLGKRARLKLARIYLIQTIIYYHYTYLSFITENHKHLIQFTIENIEILVNSYKTKVHKSPHL